MYKYIKYNTEDDTENSEKVVHVTVESAAVQESISKAAQKVQSEVSIKGFRQGHAPMDVVMSTYQQDILERSSRDLFNDLLTQIIEKEKLTPIATTQVANEEGENDKETVLVFRIPVYPEVAIPDLDSIKVEAQKLEVTEEEIDEGVKRIWNNYSKDEKAEQAFTEDVFKQMNIPSVHDMPSLRMWVKESIVSFKESQLRAMFGKEFLDKALEKSQIKVHEQILLKETDRREEELNRYAQRNKTTFEEVLKSENMGLQEYKDKLKEDVTKSIQTEIFLRELGKKWNIIVDNEELDNEVKNASNLASKYTENPEYVKEIVKDSLLREKTYNQLIEKYYKK